MKEESEVPSINPEKPKFWKNSNLLLSFSAIFISVVSLSILIYQTRLAAKQFELEQKQQLASVMPYLQIWKNNYKDGFSITIENFGVGPAFIKSVNIHYKDSTYQSFDYPEMYNILKSKGGYVDNRERYSSLLKGMVIPSGKQTIHLKVVHNENGDFWDDIFLSNEFELEIEYASLYDERWVVKGFTNEPIKTKWIDD